MSGRYQPPRSRNGITARASYYLPRVQRTLHFIAALAALACLPSCGARSEGDPDDDAGYRTWSHYLGDPGRRHYSALDQLDTANVADLEEAWTYRSGDAGANTRVQCNPLYAEGRLFAVTAGLALVALDADDGRELWRFAPFAAEAASQWTGQSRGLHLWRDARRGDSLMAVWAVADRVYVLDAATGAAGLEIELRAGLAPADESPSQLAVTTPGAVYGDLLVLGFMTAEAHPATRGSIRAFDLRTGREAWRFNTLPDADAPGADTWDDPLQLARAAGANNWAGMALDEASGTLYVPTGTAVDDFYGGGRLGDNLYANCLLALDAATGALRWHRQLVRHDLWDRDLPSPPTLVEVTRGGQLVEAVAQPTKHGFVYVFDRHSGEPLFDLVDVPAPPSPLAGERAAPAQPEQRGLPAIARRALTRDDLNLAAADYPDLLTQFDSLRRGDWAPPSSTGTLMSPGYDGGPSWGGSATAPGTGLLVVNVNERPSVVTLREQTRALPLGERTYAQACASCHGLDRAGGVFHAAAPALRRLDGRYSEASLATLVHDGKGAMPAFGHLSAAALAAVSRYVLDLPPLREPPAGTQTRDTSYAHVGYAWFVDAEGYPAVRPPWGTIAAYDLNAARALWRRPLGVDSVWAARGDSLTGTLNYGGPVVTAGGLVFVAATTDRTIRALDLRTGRTLWRRRLPFDGVATPSIYEHAGRQYVVVAAGGGKASARRGDAYVAFALPPGE